ncbi:sterol desaturase family protein [Variovorax gossypii]
MHRVSHAVPWLWRLHAPHHSAERLYWLNGDRRHPLHAALMAAPGLTVLFAMGTPSELVAAWLAILVVHLTFQHSNLDYSLGPMRHLIGVAETHRWHHKRDFEDAQGKRPATPP